MTRLLVMLIAFGFLGGLGGFAIAVLMSVRTADPTVRGFFGWWLKVGVAIFGALVGIVAVVKLAILVNDWVIDGGPAQAVHALWWIVPVLLAGVALWVVVVWWLKHPPRPELPAANVMADGYTVTPPPILGMPPIPDIPVPAAAANEPDPNDYWAQGPGFGR